MYGLCRLRLKMNIEKKLPDRLIFRPNPGKKKKILKKKEKNTKQNYRLDYWSGQSLWRCRYIYSHQRSCKPGLRLKRWVWIPFRIPRSVNRVTFWGNMLTFVFKFTHKILPSCLQQWQLTTNTDFHRYNTCPKL